jgi:hypothetical protein
MQTSINATAGLRRITVCGERQKWYVHVPDYGDVGIMPSNGTALLLRDVDGRKACARR